jgi:hypothetical protein
MSRQTRHLWAAIVASLAVLGWGIAGAQGAPPAQVPSAGTPTVEDIRDIRGPKPLPASWLVWASAAGGGALLLGGLYAAWRRYQSATVDILTPSEVALRRLDGARPLIAAGACREFSVEVSDAIRGYVEKRFGINASQRTTDEFLRDQLLTADARLAGFQGPLAKFLNQCDLAKFSGWSLSANAMETMYGSAHRFVELTTANDPTREPTAHQSPISAKDQYVQLPAA